MDAPTPFLPAPPPGVLALGLDGAARRLVDAAAALIGARVDAADDEAGARLRVADDVCDVAIAGSISAPAPDAAPPDVAAVLHLARALGGGLPVLLLGAPPAIDAAQRLRLAAEGIEVVEPAPDAAALAQRIVLLARGRRVSRDTEGRAEALLRVNEALVAGLVHDLRTPLMAINLSAEVAGARSAEESVRQAVRRIRSSTQRMTRTLDHLMNLSRLDPRERLANAPEGDLGTLVQQAIDAVQAEHPDATIELVRHGDLLARFDRDAMARAVRHLVATAVAHADGERVGVRVDGSAPDRIWIEVATLRAIPPDAQERLMGPPRARAGREQPGLALGLHAIEETVRAHAASVVGRSKAPEGTVFELLLPRDARAT